MAYVLPSVAILSFTADALAEPGVGANKVLWVILFGITCVNFGLALAKEFIKGV